MAFVELQVAARPDGVHAAKMINTALVVSVEPYEQQPSGYVSVYSDEERKADETLPYHRPEPEHPAQVVLELAGSAPLYALGNQKDIVAQLK